MSGRLDGIQILRFVAAVMVLIQHAVYLPSIHYGIDVLPFRKLGLGTAGVFIFFVISGYVIAALVEQRPFRFALHRIARIYPPYLSAIAISAALLISIGAVDVTKIRWLWSFTLLPLGGAIDSWTQVPFWTLIYEMTFYAVTAAMILGGKRVFDIGLVLWAGVIVGTAYFLPAPPAFTANILAILTSPLSLLFIAGAALGRLHAGTSWPLVYVGILLWTGYWRSSTLYQSIPVFVVGTLATIHLAALASNFVSRQNWLSPLVRGGDYSYGLYLLHAPVISALVATGLTKSVTYPIAVAVCLLIGGGLGSLFGFADFWFYRNVARKWADRIADTKSLQPLTSSVSELTARQS
ncbi:acyltransferase [Bradyrhizobium sp. G127]|uniref:acyltransferase family protein n=1 Tax=Bradyrhizobium sp. G127 TaxID=2904800 RepID=UPI001F1EED98|nr:acyltransferase [Bradyrhizobium sp. G127]MCF2522359.1 acyltransferase [Bradyrhizobium sp. G127]